MASHSVSMQRRCHRLWPYSLLGRYRRMHGGEVGYIRENALGGCAGHFPFIAEREFMGLPCGDYWAGLSGSLASCGEEGVVRMETGGVESEQP